MIVLFVIAIVLLIIGVLFVIIDYLNDAVETKKFGMCFIIAAAAICVVKWCLENPKQVSDIIKTIMDIAS